MNHHQRQQPYLTRAVHTHMEPWGKSGGVPNSTGELYGPSSTRLGGGNRSHLRSSCTEKKWFRSRKDNGCCGTMLPRNAWPSTPS